MHDPARTPAAATLAFLIIAAFFTPATSAQRADGVVRGEITDTSGGVLPGVTVVATSTDGRILGKTVTSDVGRFEIGALPAGLVKLAFELDGFERSNLTVMVQPGADVSIVERLKVARLKEDVVVYGKVPVDPPPPPKPPPPPPPLPPPPPRPTVIPVPPQELESICGPRKPGAASESFGTIRSHRYDYGRTLYTKGDELVIDGGSDNGLEVGQNLVVRRYFRANNRAAEIPEMGEHTAGLVQIITIDERSSTAIVVHTCNELMKGDLLASFIPQPVRVPDAAGAPAYEDAARILFADDGQMLGVPRRLMVIDRGSDQGIRAGQRLTLFRRKGDGINLAVLGEAVVISVRSDSATIRVVNATDAIEFGDWAAPQRPLPATRPRS